ncbi:MAG: hypothetical protein KatS3mg115_1278 [Candidatus Poribacteria bacterium]|nr:MAG: hypothetical protein KatS3mg115_1278 [Candidatus Poribacteria bacterium]
MPSPRRKPHILVVDDTPENIRLVGSILNRFGYELTIATSGPQAIASAQRILPDLILLDIMMPGMDGFTTCRQLKAMEETRDIPVIFLTAKVQEEDIAKGFQVGGVDYITKPFRVQELVARVRTHVELYSLRRELERRVQQRTQEIERAHEELKFLYEELQRMNAAALRFVPREFLHLLGQANVYAVELGDFVQRDLTILFSDIRDFTTLSEGMTPEETFRFINRYLGEVGPCIRTCRGFIDKYMGDGIMALFPESPEDAVQAAIKMKSTLQEYNRRREAQGQHPIRTGIGIHSGFAMLGTVGEPERMDGTVISDAVNAASRLEALTKYYGADAILSARSWEGVQHPERYHVRFLGRAQVKGRAQPLIIYELLDAAPEPERELKLKTRERFEEGLQLYYARDFAEASVAFHSVLRMNPSDLAARLYLERAATYLVHGVPEGWNGVEVFTNK